MYISMHFFVSKREQHIQRKIMFQLNFYQWNSMRTRILWMDFVFLRKIDVRSSSSFIESNYRQYTWSCWTWNIRSSIEKILHRFVIFSFCFQTKSSIRISLQKVMHHFSLYPIVVISLPMRTILVRAIMNFERIVQYQLK